MPGSTRLAAVDRSRQPDRAPADHPWYLDDGHGSSSSLSLGAGHRKGPEAQAARPRSALGGENAGLGRRRSPRLGGAGLGGPCRPSGSNGGDRILSNITNVSSRDAGKPPKPTAATRTSVSQAASLAPPELAQVPAPAPAWEAGADPQQVTEYVADINQHLHSLEHDCPPRPDYMDALQPDLNGKMRAILVDWLVEVHTKYRLHNETLFLTVQLIDRYLSAAVVSRQKLQLVGVVAMFLAAKFEEINPPDVQDFVYITDNTYTKKQLLDMECRMLATLGFAVAKPTACHFLDKLQGVNGGDGAHKELVQYLAELALTDLPMIRHSPSHLAAAAVLLSNELVKRQSAWPPALAQQARHAETALRDCADDLLELYRAAATSTLQAVRLKYSSLQRRQVAKLTF